MAKAFEGCEGKVLASIRVARDDDVIRLEFEDGTDLYVQVEGDCCSYSYWYEILEGKSNIGGTITNVEVLDLPVVSEDLQWDELTQAYGYAVKTTKGVVTFVFRNDSNGYYGGWAYNVDGVPSGTTWRHRVDSNDWRAQ